jgi:hypothetical protein
LVAANSADLGTKLGTAYRRVMEEIFRWTTPEDAIAEEVRYRASVSPSERVAAVETLRQRTPEIYGDAPSVC